MIVMMAVQRLTVAISRDDDNFTNCSYQRLDGKRLESPHSRSHRPLQQHFPPVTWNSDL